MIRYEVLCLTVPEITLDEATALETQVRNVVKEHKGAVISFERWGKFMLAYPINHKDYGVYFLVRYEADQTAITSLNEAIKMLFSVKYSELVVRYLIDRLDVKQTLVYQRPESLEEMPGQTTDSLMREHKIGFESRGGRYDRDRGGMRDRGSHDSMDSFAEEIKD